MICEVVLAGAFALATLRRCSVRVVIIFVSFFTLGNGMAVPEHSPAEINFPRGIESCSYAHHEPINSAPWKYPCGTPHPVMTSAMKNYTQEQSICSILRRVQTQLKIARDYHKQDFEIVRHIYVKVRKMLKSHYNKNWMPLQNAPSYQENKEHLNETAKFALPELYKGIQTYAITFHQLLHFELKNETGNITHVRKEIMNRMYLHNLQVLCEVKTALETLGAEVPTPEKALVARNNSNYLDEGGLTEMLTQDWGVLKFYRIYLQNWTRTIRNATEIEHCKKELSEKKKNIKRFKLGKKMSKMRKSTKLSKYFLAKMFNQNISLPSLLQRDSIIPTRKKPLSRRPTRKRPARKKFPKNRLMRNNKRQHYNHR